MTPEDYQCEFTAAVTPEKALEEISRVAAWWATNFTGRAEKVGDTFTIRFGETWVTFRISELVPASTVVWDVVDCHLHWLEDKTEWQGTKVVWDVATQGDSTRVRLTHAGLVPTVECYNDCREGWHSFVTGSLLKLVTTGHGEPR